MWLYIPDYNKNGQMAHIEKIPAQGQKFSNMEEPYHWEESTECAGFIVSADCPWRTEEMSLITFKPDACSTQEVKGCEELIAYARIVDTYSTK